MAPNCLVPRQGTVDSHRNTGHAHDEGQGPGVRVDNLGSTPGPSASLQCPSIPQQSCDERGAICGTVETGSRAQDCGGQPSPCHSHGTLPLRANAALASEVEACQHASQPACPKGGQYAGQLIGPQLRTGMHHWQFANTQLHCYMNSCTWARMWSLTYLPEPVEKWGFLGTWDMLQAFSHPSLCKLPAEPAYASPLHTGMRHAKQDCSMMALNYAPTYFSSAGGTNGDRIRPEVQWHMPITPSAVQSTCSSHRGTCHSRLCSRTGMRINSAYTHSMSLCPCSACRWRETQGLHLSASWRFSTASTSLRAAGRATELASIPH